jgi:hypothetical protein
MGWGPRSFVLVLVLVLFLECLVLGDRGTESLVLRPPAGRDVYFIGTLGLEPQAESCCPFGTEIHFDIGTFLGPGVSAGNRAGNGTEQDRFGWGGGVLG